MVHGSVPRGKPRNARPAREECPLRVNSDDATASMNGEDQCGEPHRSLEGPGYLGMWLIKSANMEGGWKQGWSASLDNKYLRHFLLMRAFKPTGFLDRKQKAAHRIAIPGRQ